MGAETEFEAVLRFFDNTGTKQAPTLSEGNGITCRIQNVGHNSSMRLCSDDVKQQFGVIFLNRHGRQAVVDVSFQKPRAPEAQWASS